MIVFLRSTDAVKVDLSEFHGCFKLEKFLEWLSAIEKGFYFYLLLLLLLFFMPENQ